MDPPSVQGDIENAIIAANPPSPQPPISTKPQLVTDPLQVDPHVHPTTAAPEVQTAENHGDPSDGLWSMYLTESEKRDKQVIETWKGDTSGILVFTGLFSATVAAFIIESYKNLSPNPSETTNELLGQIFAQLVNNSNGTHVSGLELRTNQLFKPTASAVRVNVLWFISLVLSLNCALFATLIQHWAQRYQELAQRPVSIHMRGRMRAYISNGIKRFGMARAVATMPILLHISVSLFFVGLIEFLFPIYATVAYSTLGCIAMFAFEYAMLTVLPAIYHDCPYSTPLTELVWSATHSFVFGFLWTLLKIGGLFRKPDGLKKWRDTLKRHRLWFSDGLRKSVELSAYEAKTTVVTSALARTLDTLYEDKEIEDFAVRVPGFFDSQAFLDATSAVLSLMSHQPKTVPIFGSRLYDLLETCFQRTPTLDKKKRTDRLQVCLNCLWYFGRAYNRVKPPDLLPSYFPDTLASPKTTRRVQTEEDSGVRVIGRCYLALIANKLVADLKSRGATYTINARELACLTGITGTRDRDMALLLSHPGAVELANMISLTSGVSGLIDNTVLQDVVEQTLTILSRDLKAQESAELERDHAVAIIGGLEGRFELMPVSCLLSFLNTCIPTLKKEVRLSCLRVCLKGLWYFARMSSQPRNSVPLPSYICIAFSKPVITRHEDDLDICVLGHCIRTLVLNKLATNIKSHPHLVSNEELVCLSAILGTERTIIDTERAILDTESHNVPPIRGPGTITFSIMSSLIWPNIYPSSSAKVPPDVLDMVQQTLMLSQALQSEFADMRFQTDYLKSVFDGASTFTDEAYMASVRLSLMKLWHFTRAYNGNSSVPLPSFIRTAFSNPEMTLRGYQDDDLATQIIGHCVGALVVNKLAADIKKRGDLGSDEELACLSAILGTESHDLELLLSHRGAIELTNMVFFAMDDICFTDESVPDLPDLVKQTLSILFQALPSTRPSDLSLIADVPLDQTDLMNPFDGDSPFMAEMYRNVLPLYLTKLWDFTRTYNGRRSRSGPFPSYICIAFTNPEMTRRIYQEANLATQVIGRCVWALASTKLAADLKSNPVSDWEHSCLAAILGTESRDARHCLSQSGTFELMIMASLAFSDVSNSLWAKEVPPDARDAHDVLQQTLDILSEALPEVPVQEDTVQDALKNISDHNFEYTIVSHLHGLLKMCMPSSLHLATEVHPSFRRMCLKVLWQCSRTAHQQTYDPLPPYFHLVLARPEVILHFQNEQDPVVRVTGSCFAALTSSQLVIGLKPTSTISRKSLDNDDAKLACISTILGEEYREGVILPCHLRIINFRNVFSLIGILSPAEGTVQEDVLNIVEQTLIILAERFQSSRRWYIPESLPGEQQRLFGQIHSIVMKAGGRYWLKDGTMEKDELQQVLDKLLSLVEKSQDTAMQNRRR